MGNEPEKLLELLYRALNSPHGIVIQTDDPVRTKQKLYAERLKDSDLGCLSFLTSPFNPASEIVILKKEQTDGERGEE